MSTHERTSESGVTLVELIVVTMIASVVLVVLGSAILVAARSMREAEAREITSQVRTDARKVILADLQSATTVLDAATPQLAIRDSADGEYTTIPDAAAAVCPDRSDGDDANDGDVTVFRMTSVTRIRMNGINDPDVVQRTAEYRLTDHPSYGCSLLRVLTRDGVDTDGDGEGDNEASGIVVRHIDPTRTPAVEAVPMCTTPFPTCPAGPAAAPNYVMPRTWSIRFNVKPFPAGPEDYAGDGRAFSYPVTIIGQRRVDTAERG